MYPLAIKCIFAIVCVRLEQAENFSLFAISAYVCYYSWVSLHFLILFMNFIILFSLFFNFFYNFSKISGSQTDPKWAIPKRTLCERLDPDEPAFAFSLLFFFFFFPTRVSVLGDKCTVHALLSTVHVLLSRDFWHFCAH